MRQHPKKSVPLLLLFIFISAVLIPSIALGFLALRAAERESLYIERSLEDALLAEAKLSAGKIETLLHQLSEKLQKEASEKFSDIHKLYQWREQNEFVNVAFIISNRRIELAAPNRAEQELFKNSFGLFLTDQKSLPIYESIAQVYRKEMQPLNKIGSSKTNKYKATSSASDRVSLETPPTPSPKPLPQKKGVERQIAESSLASDPKLREQAFEEIAEKGFGISQRNITVTKVPSDFSNTVSLERYFSQIREESQGGLLPHLSDQGLELLFWTLSPDGNITGCSLKMDILREHIADVLPDIFSKVRLLTVLDDKGKPLVVPAVPSLNWQRPFVAVEISPLLPRWEVGVWLTDPTLPASRARLTKIAVFSMVGVLIFLILVGGIVVMRMLTFEMRVAAQKTSFLANVSHELKTPLTSIKLFAELLLSGRQTNEVRRKEYLQTMVSETDRLARLVDDVLVFSGKKKEKWAMQNLDLGHLAREIFRQVEPQLSRNGFRTLFREVPPLPVSGNPEALRQIILNLLSNAEKYSENTRSLSIHAYAKESTAIIKILDRGIGIPPRLAEKIFQEFFRADDSLSASRSGAGLGLAIARNLARKHGGEILYSPRKNGGSIFALHLPLRQDP